MSHKHPAYQTRMSKGLLWRILANTIHATGGTSSGKNNSPALRGELKIYT